MTALYVTVFPDGADIPLLNLRVAVFPGYDPLVVVIHILQKQTRTGIYTAELPGKSAPPYYFDGIVVL